MKPPLWTPLLVSNASRVVQVLSLGKYEGLWQERIAAAKGWPAACGVSSWCAQWLAQSPLAWRSALWVAVPPRPLQRWHLVEEVALGLKAQGVKASVSTLRWQWRAATFGSRQKSASRLKRLAARERFAARSVDARARRGSAGTQDVVLYDDVTTTGATLREAACCLTAQGWNVVGGAVLAHTPSVLKPRKRE